MQLGSVTQDRFATMALIVGAALVISGCGDQDHPVTSNTPAATPSPTPSPSAAPIPAPNPAPQPTFVSLPTFEVGVDVDDGGAFRLLAPLERPSSPVAISDPDAPNGASISNLDFDGDETITTPGIEQFANRPVIASPNQLQSSSSYSFTQAGALSRRLSKLAWIVTPGSQSLALPLLEIAEKTPNASGTTSRYPRNAQVLEVSGVSARSLRIFGSPIAAVPASGARRYVGEVFGSVYPSAEAPSRFVGDAIITVFFGDKPYASGLINFSQYERSDNTGLPLKIQFTADIVAGKLVTRSIVVTGTGKQLAFGSVAGGFYGDDASNLGFTAAARGLTGIAIFAAVLEASR